MGDAAEPPKITIAHVAMYVVRGDYRDATGPTVCYVGYDRYFNVAAATPRRSDRWVKRILDSNGGWVQTHPCTPGLVEDKLSEGRRLRITQTPA